MSIGENLRELSPVEGSVEVSPAGDCPECRVPESVLQNLCQVCFAELDELAAS